MSKRHCAREFEVITPGQIERIILEAIPGSKVHVSDMTGTSDHFEIHVEAREFEGLSLIDQHKMIFSILEDEMESRIHAVKLKTKVLNG